MPARSRSAPIEVAAEIARVAEQRSKQIEIVRNGSRGLYWLEPMVEVETPHGPHRLRAGRSRAMSPSLFDAGFLDGGDASRSRSARPKRFPS